MKLFDKWKEEWWAKHSDEISTYYETEYSELIKKHEAKKEELLKRIKLEEDDLTYRLARIDDRKIELERLDADYKLQIKIVEAKSHPSNVWAEAFTAGANKVWDLIAPVMIGNLEKLKSTIQEEAIEEAIRRLGGHNKKIK